MNIRFFNAKVRGGWRKGTRRGEGGKILISEAFTQGKGNKLSHKISYN